MGSVTPWTTRHSDLSQDDQSNLEKVLFLLDKFYVCDEVYHELSVFSEDLCQGHTSSNN